MKVILLLTTCFHIFYAINCFTEEMEFIDFNEDLQCIHIPNESEYKQFVIKAYEEYDRLFQFKSNKSSCKNFKLPFVDFNKYTLLGSYTSGGGCSVKFSRKIIRNKREKKYIYEVTTNRKGLCELFRESMNWVLIPKIPEEYSVYFKYH